MNQVYYVPSTQHPTQIYHHATPESKHIENTNQLKQLQEKIVNFKSLNINKNPISSKQTSRNIEHNSKTKLYSQRRQNSNDFNQFSLLLNISNVKKNRVSKPSIQIPSKQKNNSQHWNSPKTYKNFDQKAYSKDKTVLKTEPDIQIPSERQIYKSNSSKQIQDKQNITQKEKMKSICRQIKPLQKDQEEIKQIIYENQEQPKLNTNQVQEKILDLLLLSTRELKYKLSDKQTNSSHAPLTRKIGLPADFFFQKV